MSKTAHKSYPIPGKKLYQERAAAALPILVRQAESHSPITYSGLAAELGMVNPRNLNYVLGSVGATIDAIAKKTKSKIPPLQALVINQGSGLPGHGFDNYNPAMRLDKMTGRQRTRAIRKLLDDVFSYGKWNDLLKQLELEPLEDEFSELAVIKPMRMGSGESEMHKRLKNWVAKNPLKVGVRGKTIKTVTEHTIHSGDVIDVFFEQSRVWAAIEVKSVKSPDADLLRGIFQCVKYGAVLEAVSLMVGKDVDIVVKLALEGDLPPEMRTLANRLGVTVIERVME